MADNVGVTPGAGATIATDDVGGVQFQRVKLDVGGDGVSSPVSTDNPLPSSSNLVSVDYAPQYAPSATGITQASADPSGQASIRGPVLTDEGGYRGNFANASLAVSIGSCTFANGSDIVTGTSFSTYDVHLGDYVYLTSDGPTYAVQIDSISEDKIILASPYAGTGGTGASSRQYFRSITYAGTSIAISGGQITLASGTTNNSVCEIQRDVDYLPLTKQGRFSISQRIANQDVYYGFYSNTSPQKWWYWFHFTGTTNTVVNCVCAWNPTGTPTGGEISTTTVTLPNGLTTASLVEYRVDIVKDRVVFTIAGIPVLQEARVVPHPHDIQVSTLRIVNGTGASGSTSVVADFDGCSNYNVVSVENPTRTTDFVATQPPLDRFAYSVAGVITINTVLLSVDCSRYKSLSWQCTSMGTTGVVTPEWSSDANTWVGDTFFTIAGASATTFNAAGAWVSNVRSRYFRLRLSTATTAGTTTINVDGCAVRQSTFLATQPISGTVTSGGAAAHDAAISGNPTRIAGRALTANYATVATGDTADLITTLQGVLITKDNQIHELEYNVHDRITASSTTAVQVKAATASLKNFATSLTLATDTLGAAGDIMLRSTPVASTTATIASNTLVMAATYGWKVGDIVLVTASTVTGLSAGSYYYLLTVSGANLTFSTSRGGSTAAISGTSVSATLTKVIWRTKLQTTSLPLTQIVLCDHDSGGTGLATEMVLPSSLTSGQIDFSVQGYVAP